MGVKIEHRPIEYAPVLRNVIAPVMPKIALYLQSSANRKINKGVSPENAPLTIAVKGGSKTLRDNNELASSIAPHHGKDWADASTNKKQARILQEGGTIRSKGKGLWIPAGKKTRELMRTYGTRKPDELIAAMKAAGYTFFFTPLSKVFCAQKGKGKPFKLFLVKSSITIPARPYLFHDDRDVSYIQKLITQALRDGIKEKQHGNTD